MTKQSSIETLEIFRNDYTREGSAICRAIDIAIDALRHPTIEPKRGERMETEPDEDDRKIGIEFSIKCSRCHDENSHLDFNENHEITGKTFWKSRFCPNCGAYMRGRR